MSGVSAWKSHDITFYWEPLSIVGVVVFSVGEQAELVADLLF